MLLEMSVKIQREVPHVFILDKQRVAFPPLPMRSPTKRCPMQGGKDLMQARPIVSEENGIAWI